MRALLPLAVLALAACDPPLEELHSPRYYTLERGGVPYEARAQFDPFERGWFIRVTSLVSPLEIENQAVVFAAVQEGLAPQLCESGALAIKQGDVWNPLAVKEVLFLPDLGAFQLVGRCSDRPLLPSEIAVYAPDGALIGMEGADVAVVVEDSGQVGIVSDEMPAVIVTPETQPVN